MLQPSELDTKIRDERHNHLRNCPPKTGRNPKFHHCLRDLLLPVQFIGGPRFSHGNKVIYGGPRDYIIENPNPEVFSDAEHLALGLMSSDRIMRLKPRLKNKYNNYCKIILDTTNNTKFQIPPTQIYIYIRIIIHMDMLRKKLQIPHISKKTSKINKLENYVKRQQLAASRTPPDRQYLEEVQDNNLKGWF